MNLSNQLTMSRIGLAMVMTASLTVPGLPFGKLIALAIFVTAALTDYWDGRLARRRYGITPFGQLMDPVADKILVSAAFICFVAIGNTVPAWIVIVIISREFLITGLRLLAASDGKILQAGRLGKHKTVWQIITIVTVLTGLALREDLLPPLEDRHAVFAVAARDFDLYFQPLVMGVSLIVAALTVISGLVYLHQNRGLFAEP